MDRTLLIVDDERSILKSLSRQLILEGYDVVTAESAEQGLAILEEKAIPVIISDQRMPSMTGSEFLSIVRERYPNTTRMILSGYADFSAVSDAINNGEIYKFLNKPWDDQTLLSQIESAFARQEKMAEEQQRSQLMEHTIEALMITNTTHVVLSINHSFSSMTEYEEEEVIGNILDLIDYQREPQNTLLDIKKILEVQNAWHGELWLSRKSGTSFPTYVSISSMKDSDGVIQQYIYSFIDISAEKQLSEKLAYQTQHDQLTGVLNRHKFIEEVTHFLQEGEASCSIILIDIDRFTQINNVHGHWVGDLLLIQIANILKLRLLEGDVLARLGNDEFAILVKDIDDPKLLNTYIQNLKEPFQKPHRIRHLDIHIMFSVGVSLYPRDGRCTADLMMNAYSALQWAKHIGVNMPQYFDSAMKPEGSESHALENALRKGIREDQFVLYFQPKLCLQTNQITGVEVLLRWQHPERGIVSPAEFIPLLERTGLILDIEKQTIMRACQTIRRWEVAGITLQLSLNISGKEFFHPDLVRFVEDALRLSGIQPQHLELEITESILHYDIKKFSTILHELRQLNISLALDDLGTGYSSLKYLTQLPFDVIKIDQSFAHDMLQNARSKTILCAMVDLCRNLGLKSVVEGVEHPEQLEAIRAMRADYVQGYLLAKPMSENDFLTWLAMY